METSQPSLLPRPHGRPVPAANPDHSRGRRHVALVLVGALGLAVAGCPAPDDIEHYRAPKSEPLLAKPASGPVRLLVAMVPHEDQTWFFKLTGPPAEVEEQRKEFDQFLASVHFTGKGEPPVEWKVPESWRSEAGDPTRDATFRFGKDGALELAVTHFGAETRQLLPNVNRWRGQIGLGAIGADEVAKVTSKTTVGGDKATLIDMTGPGGKGGPKMPPFAHPPMDGAGGAAPARGVPEYVTPPGWQKADRPVTRFAVAEFTIGAGDREARATISLAGGDPVANIQRWREQLGLPPGTEDEVKKDVRPIEVDGNPGQFVDLAGPESAGRQRILGVIVVRGGQSWFIKLRGPADLVESQKAAFEAFVKSVRFGAGPGDKHE
jgi:hypothetical protein